MIEIWKKIEGFKIYEISNFGRMRSLDRYVNSGIKHSDKTFRKGIILKPSTNQDGYMCVTLRNNNLKKTMLIHRLVATSFIDNNSNYKIINHKDGNKFNNHFNNLEWCTTQMNTEHAVLNNLLPYGEKHHNSKLTQLEVDEIRRLHDIGFSNSDMAKLYKVTRQNIRSIVNYGTWKK